MSEAITFVVTGAYYLFLMGLAALIAAAGLAAIVGACYWVYTKVADR